MLIVCDLQNLSGHIDHHMKGVIRREKALILPVIESVRRSMLFNLIVLDLDLIIYNIRNSSSSGI